MKKIYSGKIPVIAGAIIILILLLLIIFKNSLFHYYSAKKINQIEKTYYIDFQYDEMTLHGLNKIQLKNLSVRNSNYPLLQINDIRLKFNPFKALFGKFNISQVEADSFKLLLYRDSNLCNYNIRKKSVTKDTIHVGQVSDYRKKVVGFYKLIEGIIPSSMNVNSISVNIHYFNEEMNFSTSDFHLSGNTFDHMFQIKTHTSISTYRIGYHYKPSEHIIRIKTVLLEGLPAELPFLKTKWNLSVAGTETEFLFQLKHPSAEEARVEGAVEIKKAKIFHFRISADTIGIGNLTLNYAVRLKNKAIELDSSTTIGLNQFKVNLYALYDKSKGRRVVFAFNIPRSEVRSLINSIPKSIFQNLDGFDATGQIAYRFMIDVDLNQPDSLIFFNKLYRYNFQIRSLGNINTKPLLDEFEYTAYKDEKPVRTFMVGPSNPYYTPIDQISDYLKKAVIYSEDGAFYYHAGFIEEAIRDAIITNIKHRRFVRGGSTITMQFVKNMFLSSKKVITRKIEEIIITWLIERYRLLTKDRIFEIYLNFIEWGPKIYGIGEASHFYFQKHPSKLSLDESVFLAGIIPRPASFMWAFDAQGKLKKYFVSRCQFLINRMLKKEAITQDDFDRFTAEISLTGRAKEFLKIDSLAVDTTFIDDLQ